MGARDYSPMEECAEAQRRYHASREQQMSTEASLRSELAQVRAELAQVREDYRKHVAAEHAVLEAQRVDVESEYLLKRGPHGRL